MTRLVADVNMSRRFVGACQRLQRGFPSIHLNDWLDGSYRLSNDRAVLQALREQSLILVGFDRRTMAVHAGQLTREERGHAGVILFRRLVSQMDYGKQSRLLVDFWKEAQNWEWTDRICYLPGVKG